MKTCKLRENTLHEATAKEFMTSLEKAIQKRLIALLRDDGKGHHHAKYAERLGEFIVKIIDHKRDPEFTASMDFDNKVLRISSGFLNDNESFEQLSVLMRHELAHYLMLHQLRMAKVLKAKYGDEGYEHIQWSKALHKLENIIADFEISNERYSENDKIIARNMKLAGEVIGGLVTEKSRRAWAKMSLEEMYKALTQEIQSLHDKILRNWNYTIDWSNPEARVNQIAYDSKIAKQLLGNIDDDDVVSRAISGNIYLYANSGAPTNYLHNLDAFIQDKGLYHFIMFDDGLSPCIVRLSSLPDLYQKLIKTIYTEFVENNDFDQTQVKQIIEAISRSNPTSKYELKSSPASDTILYTLYTPEEKLLATDTLKAALPLLKPYQTWYDKVQKALSDSKYSKADIEKILNALNK